MNDLERKDAPAFDFYAERWLAGVAGFTDAEQLSFLRLLCHQWIERGLDDDLPKLKRLAGKGVTVSLLKKFPVGPDGLRRNARLEVIRKEQRERIASKRLGAALTNAVRYGLDSLNEDAQELVLSSPKGRKLFASEIAARSLASRHHPPPTTHPDKEIKNAGDPGRAQAGLAVGSDRLAMAERILTTYSGRRDSPNDCLTIILGEIDRGQDAGEFLSLVQRCVSHIEAGGGWANQMVPMAIRFFSQEQWRSPDAFVGRGLAKAGNAPAQRAKQETEAATKDRGGQSLPAKGFLVLGEPEPEPTHKTTRP